MRRVFVAAAGIALAALVLPASSDRLSRPSADTVRLDPLAAISGGAAAESVALSTQEMTAAADAIVVGRITTVESRWTDPRNLATFATVAVDQVLKGAAVPELTVVVPGGIDANRRVKIAMTFPGAPRLDQEERVLLFLAADADVADAYAVVGYAQGKFSIVADANGREVVTRGSAALRLASGPGVTPSTLQMVSLAEVAASIRALVR
jgi:hypothetical protein